MRLELRRDAMIVIPETDQDHAYIEDTLGLKEPGAIIALTRVHDVSLGFVRRDHYVLKSQQVTYDPPEENTQTPAATASDGVITDATTTETAPASQSTQS